MAKQNKVAFTIYEESNPLAKVMDFLITNHFAAVISPLHDSDVWTEQEVEQWKHSQWTLHKISIPDGATEYAKPTGELRANGYGAPVPVTETAKVPQVGELKKAHRHVYIEFDYSMPLETALGKVAPLNINYLEVINSRRGYLRYLCHLDTPEKARYAVEDTISLGGVDISCLWQQDDTQKYEQDGEIYQIIKENKVHSVNRLQNILIEMGKVQMYKEVKAHFGYWVQYLRGAYYVVGNKTVADGDVADGKGTDDKGGSAA